MTKDKGTFFHVDSELWDAFIKYCKDNKLTLEDGIKDALNEYIMKESIKLQLLKRQPEQDGGC